VSANDVLEIPGPADQLDYAPAMSSKPDRPKRDLSIHIPIGDEARSHFATTLAARRLIGAASNRKLVRFGLVGLTSTVISLAVYGLLLLVGLPYPAAGFLSYGAGIVNGYTWNRVWTFQAGAFQKRQFARYGIVQTGAAAANAGGLALAFQIFGASEIAAEVVVLPLLVCAAFVINRDWTFRHDH
jgi:putative flippase GtrA